MGGMVTPKRTNLREESQALAFLAQVRLSRWLVWRRRSAACSILP